MALALFDLTDEDRELCFYALAAAAWTLNLMAIIAVVCGVARGTPRYHTAVMVANWVLYQGAFMVYRGGGGGFPGAPPPGPCGFCPRTLRFDLDEDFHLCTGYLGPLWHIIILPWQHYPRGAGGSGGALVGMDHAAAERARAFVWSAIFAWSIGGLAISAFGEAVRMRRMMRRARRAMRHREAARRGHQGRA